MPRRDAAGSGRHGPPRPSAVEGSIAHVMRCCVERWHATLRSRGTSRSRTRRRCARGSADGTDSRAAARTGCGIEPEIVASRERGSASTHGIERSNDCVYGCRGAWKIASTGPFSTSWPRYITTTSSVISAITPMSWVIRITARPRSCCRRRSSSRICACVVTSSAVVGSSAIRMRGSRGERQRDHHPLAQPTRQLERIGIDALRRARNADHGEQFDRPRPCRTLRQR